MNYQKEFEKRLPKGIEIKNERNIDLTEDEFVSILSWLKYFKSHYEKFGKDEHPDVIFPIISKRIHLDFGLYRFPSELQDEKGKFIIYISANTQKTIKNIINTWHL
jgi:hypothetical protein